MTITTTSLARFEPVDFDAAMVDLVDATARRLGHSTKRMPSGAGHDAQMLARICPTAMVFTPSVNGLSHNIAEFTEAVDIEAGANVLLQVVLELARPRRSELTSWRRGFDLVTIDSPTTDALAAFWSSCSICTRSNAKTATVGSSSPTATAPPHRRADAA